MSTIPSERQQGKLPNITNTIIQLAPTLCLDLEAGVIINVQKEILLTAREIHVLRILAHTMHHSRAYLSADAIAQHINLLDVNDPEHCIEETISKIRRKLGETPHHSQILRGRRGLGYRLFPIQS